MRMFCVIIFILYIGILFGYLVNMFLFFRGNGLCFELNLYRIDIWIYLFKGFCLIC